MGMYVNPGNAAFDEINNEDFVDKTMLIDLINKTIDKKNNLTCNSRPRRFGKSYAAKMLVAYFDCSCKSDSLFDDKRIAKTELYKEHMNQYNVIMLDISGFTSTASMKGISYQEIPKMIENAIMNDLIRSGFEPIENESLASFLVRIAKQPKGKKFILSLMNYVKLYITRLMTSDYYDKCDFFLKDKLGHKLSPIARNIYKIGCFVIFEPASRWNN